MAVGLTDVRNVPVFEVCQCQVYHTASGGAFMYVNVKPCTVEVNGPADRSL